VTLRDGRSFGYAVYGKEGALIIHLPGAGASRLSPTSWCQDDDLVSPRVTIVDRPGYGLSDPNPRLDFESLCDDIGELATHLNATKFGLTGVSTGASLAIACATHSPIKDRLVGVLAISPIAPPTMESRFKESHFLVRLAFTYLYQFTPFFKFTCWIIRMRSHFGRNPESIANDLKLYMPSVPDHKMVDSITKVEEKRFTEIVYPYYREAFRKGYSGFYRDGLFLASDNWPFLNRLSNITTDYIKVLHGSQDRTIFPSHGKFFCDLIPHCQYNLVENEGHMSLYYGSQTFHQEVLQLAERVESCRPTIV